jgi:hypothetical protein
MKDYILHNWPLYPVHKMKPFFGTCMAAARQVAAWVKQIQGLQAYILAIFDKYMTIQYMLA